MTSPISFLNQLLKHVLPQAATDSRIAGLLLVAKGQSMAGQALLCHPTLRLQRSELAQYRVGQEKLANMDLIKSGRLEYGNSSQGEIPKVKVGEQYKFENELSIQERIEVLSAPQTLPNAPQDGLQALPVSAAERCVLRDYIATDGYSQAMNEFLRGEFRRTTTALGPARTQPDTDQFFECIAGAVCAGTTQPEPKIAHVSGLAGRRKDRKALCTRPLFKHEQAR